MRAALPLFALLLMSVVAARADEARTPAPPVLSLAASGEASGVPDAADITIRVEAQAPKSGDAMAEMSARMTAVLVAVKDAGVEAKQIATTDVSLYPRRERLQNDQERFFFVAASAISVRVSDFAALGDVLDGAVRAGASQVDGPSLVITDMDALVDVARDRAVVRLFEKAARMACAAGMSLGRLVALGEQGASIPGPRPQMMMAMEAKSDRMAPPIEAGQRDVTADVQGAWELVPDASGACPSPLR
jgi:uncharacterized protein YggE